MWVAKPIMWHIMKTYAAHGHRRFILLLGYKSWTIKEFFLAYREKTSDFTVNLSNAETEFHGDYGTEDFEVTMAYTGLDTLTRWAPRSCRDISRGCAGVHAHLRRWTGRHRHTGTT